MRHGEEEAIYKPSREDSEESNLADTLLLGSQPSDSCFRHLVCGMMVALADSRPPLPSSLTPHPFPSLTTWNKV